MKYDFSIQEENTLQNSEDYVEIMCGKGKKDDKVIYIKTVEFSYIEGLIWDKHREYGSKAKTKISVSDWERIIEGFHECSERLNNYLETDDLKEILQFSLYRAKSPLNDIKDHIKELNDLIKSFGAWIEANMKTEKSISILKDKSQL